MAYLLDTNSWVHYLKHTDSPIRKRLEPLQPSDIASCLIVRGELLHAAKKYGDRDQRVAKVVDTLSPFVSHAFDDAAAAEFARVRHQLEMAGQIIGPFDLQIAAICLCHNLTLVTNNISEFSRVRVCESKIGKRLLVER